MTKKKIFVLTAVIFGIVAAFAACDGSDGTFTLTGIPSQYNGKYALFYGEIPNSGWYIVSDNTPTDDFTLLQIQGGSVTFTLWQVDGSSVTPYKGNDEIEVAVRIFDQPRLNGWDSMYNTVGAAYFYSTSFSNGSVTRSWASANSVQEK